MSDTLKGLLIIASVLTVGWILRKIRKNKVKMEDAIFWIFFAAILLLLAIFPEISYELCRIFGIMSPSNLVFLVIIFLLVEKIFTLSIIKSNFSSKVPLVSFNKLSNNSLKYLLLSFLPLNNQFQASLSLKIFI